MNISERGILRAIDAEVDRAREGLRVLEDLARFVLDDKALTEQLKLIRHQVTEGSAKLSDRLLESRDAAGDVGAFLDPDTEKERQDPYDLALANAKRVQESLRALEEMAKLPEMSDRLDGASFKRARFALYEAERTLAGRLRREDRRRLLKGLYVIIDPEIARGRPDVKIAQEAIAGGARVVQLRDKVRGKGEQLRVARQLQKLCSEAGVLFVVNDHVDVALAARADGVHVGQQDLPVTEVRRLLPPGAIVGCSVNNVTEAVAAEADGADYVSVGCLFPTSSKADVRPASLEVLREVRKAVRVPVAAIGGINEHNVASVMQAGAHMPAVISAVVAAPDVAAAARRLATIIEEYARDLGS